MVTLPPPLALAAFCFSFSASLASFSFFASSRAFFSATLLVANTAAVQTWCGHRGNLSPRTASGYPRYEISVRFVSPTIAPR